MLDYKDIITKRYVHHLPGAEIARILGVSKSGVNDFLKRFENCKELSFPLPPEITNAGISMKVYGRISGGGRDLSYEYPDYAEVTRLLKSRKNMTLQVCWTRYFHRYQSEGRRPYQYRQFCELFAKWTEENYETAHFAAVIAQTMEVDFTGRTSSTRYRMKTRRKSCTKSWRNAMNWNGAASSAPKGSRKPGPQCFSRMKCPQTRFSSG